MAKFGRSARLGRVLVIGGARSGKSVFAETLAAQANSIEYVATLPVRPEDPEWLGRVEPARRRRPADWTTTETQDVAGVLNRPGGPVLIDGLTPWLVSVLDETGAWLEEPGWRPALDEKVGTILQAWRETERSVLLVTDDVGGGLMPDSVSDRLFRDALGLLNQEFASAADAVWLVTAGLPQRLK